MTLHFTDWTPAFAAFALNTALPAVPRPRLMARWRRGQDGKLACRWVRLDPFQD